jgi:hypothetical protein
MRLCGSIYTFIVGILVLLPSVFDNDAQRLSYAVLDNIVFPLRDWVEVMMLSYMFYVQSGRKIQIEKVNQKWRDMQARLSYNKEKATLKEEPKSPKSTKFTIESGEPKSVPFKGTLDLGGPITNEFDNNE